MKAKLRSSMMMTWPMLPLVLVLFFWPWFHRTVISRTETATSITFCGKLVCEIAFSKESLLDHTHSDDYEFAARGRHLLLGKLLHVTWLICGLVLTMALVLSSKQSLDNNSTSVTWPPWRSLLICFSVGAAVIIAYQGAWPLVTGQPFKLNGGDNETKYILGVGSFVLLIGHPWFLAPICEELLFRSWCQKLLAGFTGPWLAIAVVALVFGLLHHSQGLAGVIQITFLALVSGILYLKTGRLWVSVALHAMANIAGSAEILEWLRS